MSGRRHRPRAQALALIGLALSAGPAGAIDLTPEVRARLFAPTAQVHLDRKVVTLRLDGTDHAASLAISTLR